MRFTTAELAALTHGSTRAPDVIVEGATQDSRAVAAGQLFVPLLAERDGHDFIDDALASGAAAYLTSREPGNGTAVVVPDTAQALTDIGAAARIRLTGPIVGITGSVGKTSTKDLLASVLSQRFMTHASRKSFNNEIGVPLTLINAPGATEVAVLEMGSRGIGHIAELCAVAKPTIGVITTIAGAHTGEFGSVENIALAKGELLDGLPRTGLAVLHADVALCADLAQRSPAPVLLFGAGNDAAIRYTNIQLAEDLATRFTIEGDWGTFDVEPATRGAHLVANATAAAGVALHLGCSIEDVQAGLSQAELSPWRMQISKTSTGATIINDTYNANPTSMRGALDSLAALPATRRVAVVGYMAELGADEGSMHREVADHAAAHGIELVTVGTDLYGPAPADDPSAVIGELAAGVAVLVKGSRSAGLESVAESLASY